MNWRRGLLLAGINLIAAVPLIFLLAARDAQFIKEREPQSAVPAIRPGIVDREFKPRVEARLVLVQEDQTVSFSPCGLWGHILPQVSAVQLGNLPAFVLSQWREACPPRWSIASMLGVQVAGLSSPDNVKAMRRVDVALCLMIAIQWFLIGGFPLIRSERWWGEPAAFITANTFIAVWIAIIPVVDGLARLPALIAFGGWLWWLASCFGSRFTKASSQHLAGCGV